MESIHIRTNTTFFASLFLLYLITSSPPPTVAETLPGTIQRATKQQIIATIPPNSDQKPQPFLSSPSGKYTASFVRHETTPGAGGFGNDFCYVQVHDIETGESVWESDCAPVSNVNTCTLVFSDAGLEVLDGSRSAWDAGAEADENLQTLELVDEGDMRITDEGGNLAWRASDAPRANQECGSPGSPGLGYAKAPFAAPISNNHPFGQADGSGRNRQQQMAGAENQQEGLDQQHGDGLGQPLVDKTPFDSGCGSGSKTWLKLAMVVLLSTLIAYGF